MPAKRVYKNVYNNNKNLQQQKNRYYYNTIIVAIIVERAVKYYGHSIIIWGRGGGDRTKINNTRDLCRSAFRIRERTHVDNPRTVIVEGSRGGPTETPEMFPQHAVCTHACHGHTFRQSTVNLV